jgi:gas vesicle structural protein
MTRSGSSVEAVMDLDERITLLDLADRLLGKGIVIRGDITLALADIDLIYISLQALIASVSTLDERAEQP